MIYRVFFIIGLFAQHAAAAPAPAEDFKMNEFNETDVDEHGSRRELFPVYALGTKCARRGCSIYNQISSVNRGVNPMMSLSDSTRGIQGPAKALEMLAMNDDLNTVIYSDSMCTRRSAMARAAGLAAGVALATVNAPGYAAETKMVKMGSDNGQLVFVPDELKICKGDTVTWVINKGGPHNVVFDEEAIPSGVSAESISMDEQLGDEGEKFSRKFDVAGKYSYYCEPHRGAGMNADLIVE
jgi:plastocyanin